MFLGNVIGPPKSPCQSITHTYVCLYNYGLQEVHVLESFLPPVCNTTCQTILGGEQNNGCPLF